MFGDIFRLIDDNSKHVRKISTTSCTADVIEKPFHEAVLEFKARLLEKALEKAKFNQKKAAHLLGVTYHQFRALYRKYKASNQNTNPGRQSPQRHTKGQP